MAVIYLQHPVHGQCVFASDLEANVARSAGWTEYDPDAKPEPVEVPAFLAAPTLVVEPPPVTEVEVPKAKAPKTLKDLSKG